MAGDKGVLRIASIYAPNGNPLGTEKFPYKLGWLERLHAHASDLLANEEPVALMGDYNVIPEDKDCYDPKAWMNDALFQPQSRAALRKIEYLGYTDAFRARHSEAGQYTFWDYQAGLLAQEPGHPHRPYPAFAPGGRPAWRLRHRPRGPRGRKTVRPRADLGELDI